MCADTHRHYVTWDPSKKQGDAEIRLEDDQRTNKTKDSCIHFHSLFLFSLLTFPLQQ